MDMHEHVNCPNTVAVPSKVAESDIEVSTQEPSSSFSCTACKQDFTDYVQYQNHMKKAHGESVKCPICRTSFRRRDHYKRHMVTVHCAENLSICPVCNDCNDHDTLIQHMGECHPDETQYHCNECQYHAKDLRSLVSHKKHHLPSNKYVCKDCNTCFKRQDHLNRHIKSLHQNQLISCEICNNYFKRKDHLLRHKREIHGIMGRKRIYNKDL